MAGVVLHQQVKGQQETDKAGTAGIAGHVWEAPTDDSVLSLDVKQTK